jgi:hypothetical protein
MTKTWQAVVIILAAAFLLTLGEIAYMTRVIHDQRDYIDRGCHGRYQGEGS